MHIFISAGEASGDLHGSSLARALRSISPETRLSCLGGPRLREAGVSVVVDHRDISVFGGSEVLGHIRAIYGSWRILRSHLLADPPDLVVLIDFPDFNFFLGKFAKKIGARVFYYISPQVWAWRERRVKTLKRLVDRMAVILPFEKAFYKSHGMAVDYVGHPLVDIIGSTPDAAASKTKCRGDIHGPLVGILPGSRRSEIKLLFELLMDSARLVFHGVPEAKFIIPVAPSLDTAMIEGLAAKWELPVRVVSGDTYGVIQACDLILTSSGTVTLEAAMLGTPMIITYRISRLSAAIGRLLLSKREWIFGLPNLIAGRQVAPEFMQETARADLIAAEAISHLRNPERLETQRREFMRIRGQLGEPGIAEHVARLVLETAKGG
ncbi:MAG: lipid-A-disaccharide synthase [Syntrophobacteraceae bacterium]